MIRSLNTPFTNTTTQHATRGLILGGKYNTLPALYLNRMDETYTKVMLSILI
jgi:hypothetical protein